MRDELRHTLELGLGTGISSLFRIAYVVYAGRALGPAAYADFYAALSLGFLFAAATAPVAGSITRFVSLHAERGEADRVAQIRARMPGRVARWALALAIFALVAARPLEVWFRFDSPLTALVLAAIIPLNLLIDTPRGILRGLHSFRWFGTSLAIESVLRLALCIIVFQFARSAPAGLAAQAAATAVVLWVTYRLLRRISPATHPSPDAGNDFRDLDRFALPLFGFAIIAALFQNVDTLFVKALFDSLDAGRFGAVSALSKLIWLLFLPFGILILPVLTTEFAARRSIWPPLLRSIGGFLLASIVVSALYGAFGASLLAVLFGRAYVPGSGSLLPLTLAVVLSGVAVLIGQAFAAMNRFHFLALYGLGLLVQIAWMLAARDSILGVVHAIAGTQLVIVVAMLGLLGLTTRSQPPAVQSTVGRA